MLCLIRMKISLLLVADVVLEILKAVLLFCSVTGGFSPTRQFQNNMRPHINYKLFVLLAQDYY